MIIENNFDLTEFNSYKVRSRCQRAFFPEKEADFIEIYQNNPDSKKILLGGGFNIILSKEQYSEDFLIIGKSFSKIEALEQGMISIEAGASTIELCQFALEHELSGVEIFFDIPSSIGGAVVMNAGASGEEIKDVLVKVRYLDLADFQIKEISKEDIGFEYRNSFFQKNTDKVVLKAWLQLKKGDPAEIEEKMIRVKEARYVKQPKNLPNAGSVFKRPKGYYVGAIIDELKLKGTSVGGAKISEKHGGFIVNYNQATGQNIIDLINHIQSKVKEKYGFELEVEQRII